MHVFDATLHVAQFGMAVVQIVQVVGDYRLYPAAQVVQDVPLEHVWQLEIAPEHSEQVVAADT